MSKDFFSKTDILTTDMDILLLDYKHNKSNKFINSYNGIFSDDDIKVLFSYGYVITDDSPRELLNSELAVILNYKNTKDEKYLEEYVFGNSISDDGIDMLFKAGFRLKENGILCDNLSAVAKNYEIYHDDVFVIDYLNGIKLNNFYGKESKLIDIIFKFFDVGFDKYDSIPEDFFKVRDVVLAMYRKTLSDVIIDRYRYLLSIDDIKEIVGLGYKVTDKSNSYILSNSDVFRFLLSKSDPNIINLYIGKDLDESILDMAFSKGFSVKDCSIQFILNNPNVFRLAFKYNQVSFLSYLIENNFSIEFIKFLSDFKDFFDRLDISDLKRQVLVCYSGFSNCVVGDKFLDKVFDIGFDKLTCSKVFQIGDLINRVDSTNSLELKRISSVVIDNLLECDYPSIYLERLERIFLKNNLPYFEKVYMVFQSLFPDVSINNNSSVLKSIKTSYVRNMIIEIDLFKCFVGSNNRNLRQYINMVLKGNSIYQDLYSKLRDLSIDLQKEYIYQYLYEFQESDDYFTFVSFVGAMKTITSEVKGKFFSSNNFVDDIFYLFHEYSDKNLSKYIFECIFSRALGVDVFDFSDVISIMDCIRDEANSRNRDFALKGDFSVKKGDLVKGLDYNGINFLEDILNNGSLCKEMLGSNSSSDVTPLDTDVSFFKKDYVDIGSAVSESGSKFYGPIWFIIKNDDRFMTTKIPSFLPWYKLDDKTLRENKFSKYELFSNGKEAGGIRTGFPSSMIDFIVVDSYDDRIGLIIAMNGFYIPVVDKSGKLVFSPNDYDLLVNKMDGLSYYGFNDYKFSDNLDCIDMVYVDESIFKSDVLIRNKIGNAVSKLGFSLKNSIDGDISSGSVELINTGSTGRGTCFGRADFDFVMRVDSDIMKDDNRLSLLRDTIMESLGGIGIISGGNIRDCSFDIDGVDIKIDISFVAKTDKLDYSTDACVRDRLSTIKKIDSEKYDLVVSNIIFAKKFMKSIGAYKPDRKDPREGGMGGIGIENWILQNGGSFIDAASDFLSVANTCLSFDEFKSCYHVYDFGFNFLSKDFPHDDFISNMNDVGYEKMKNALNKYMNYANDFENARYQR